MGSTATLITPSTDAEYSVPVSILNENPMKYVNATLMLLLKSFVGSKDGQDAA